MNLRQLISHVGLDKLNTLTKYPSIATYHEIGDKGKLSEKLTPNDRLINAQQAAYLSEKVDGTNSRIIIWNGDYLIGSREKLLYARGDLIGDPAQSIVSTVKDQAEWLADSIGRCDDRNVLIVHYMESFGGNITAASKNYTKVSGRTSSRAFDVCLFSEMDLSDVRKSSLESIAAKRERHEFSFLNIDEFNDWASRYGIDTVPDLSNALAPLQLSDIPTDIEGTYEWLKQFRETKVGLDNRPWDSIDPVGQSEGVILRTAGRSYIRKLRFEDYERTLGIKKSRG